MKLSRPLLTLLRQFLGRRWDGGTYIASSIGTTAGTPRQWATLAKRGLVQVAQNQSTMGHTYVALLPAGRALLDELRVG